METTVETVSRSHEELRREADEAYRADDYPEAIRLYTAALSRLENIAPRDRESKIRILSWLAVSHQKVGDFATARRFHEAELRLAKQLRDHEKIANALHRLGDTFLELKDDRRAERCLWESLKRFRRLGSDCRETPHLLFDLAEIAERRNQPRTAMALFREWIQVQQERRCDDVPRGWYRMGFIALGRKEWNTAEDFFYNVILAAQETGYSLWEAWGLFGLARLAKERDNLSRANRFLDEAYRLARVIPNNNLCERIQSLLGNVAFQQGLYETACLHYERFIQSRAEEHAWKGALFGFQCLGAAQFCRNKPGFAALCFAMTDAIAEQHQVEYPSGFADNYRGKCRKAVSEETWKQAQERARTMSVSEVLAYFAEE